jgi:hypothetical protein
MRILPNPGARTNYEGRFSISRKTLFKDSVSSHIPIYERIGIPKDNKSHKNKALQ